jgi:hypothetical protein
VGLHLVDQAYSDLRASDDERRVSVLWRVRRAARPDKLCRPAPARRAARAHMPRRVFLALVVGWVAALAGLLAAILILRGLG